MHQQQLSGGVGVADARQFHRRLVSIATFATSIVAASCAPPHAETTSSSQSADTASFQTGTSGYSGTVDGYIDSEYGGNGIASFADTESALWNDTTDAYEAETLVRFDGLSLPTGAQVTGATLTLTFEDWYGGNILRGYYLKNAWNPPPAGIGWQDRDTGVAWSSPGAKGVGTDIVSGLSFSDTSWTGTGDVTKTFPLDAATVQGWISNPTTNQGIILVNNEVDNHFLRVYMSESTTASYRPQLSITYSTGGGSSSGCVSAGPAQWTNSGFPSQTGTFTVQYDATPSAADIDAVAGLAQGPQQTFEGLATTTRFNASGNIDVRNGGAYAADATIAYTGGTSYHFRLVVNATAHTYSVYVTPSGGSEQTLATNYAFRTTVSSLNELAIETDSSAGSIQVCNIQTSTSDSSPPTASMTAPANNAQVSGTSVPLTATATDDVGVASVQFSVDGTNIQLPVTTPSTGTSTYGLSWDSTTISNGSHTLSAIAKDNAGNPSAASSVTVTVNNPVCSTVIAATPQAWIDSAFNGQSTSFTAEYDATPTDGLQDALLGLSNGLGQAYASNAVIARFNNTGFIDARNGSAYASQTSIPYTANTKYHFRLVVDVQAHTYSAYVTPAGGSELTIGTNYAFRDGQTGVQTLNEWNATTDSTAQSLTICNFQLSSGSGQLQGPTVAMTFPTQGASLSGTQSLKATASDSSGIASVQFTIDGGDVGQPVTTPSGGVYTLVYDTSVLTNSSHNFAARAVNNLGVPATSTAVQAFVNPPPSGGISGHPRIWIDSSTSGNGTSLDVLVAKANANDPSWQALRTQCESYENGQVFNPPNGATAGCDDWTCNLPNICCEQEGGGDSKSYYEALIANGLCYQIGKRMSPPDPKYGNWGTKGVQILTAMTNYTFFHGDGGYDIRFMGIGLAIGYDWFNDLLSDNLKNTLESHMFAESGCSSPPCSFLDWWENCTTVGRCGYENGNQNSPFTSPPYRTQAGTNYFAPYFAFKAYSSLATYDRASVAPAQWNSFLTMLQGGANTLGTHTGVAEFDTTYLDGGGWTEGWQYGNVALRNMGEPVLAAKTAFGMDLVNDSIGSGAHPYHYPLLNAEHLIQFTWPSRKYMDDRDTVHGGGACPGNARPPLNAIVSTAGLLSRWGDAMTEMFTYYALEVEGIALSYGDSPSAWENLLFWDKRTEASKVDYRNVLKPYFLGRNIAAMRSDWSVNAAWASFRAWGPLDGDEGEQFPDGGSLAISRGDTPFLVNPAFLFRCYGSTSNDGWDNNITATNHADRQIYSIFYNNSTSGQSSDAGDTLSPSMGIKWLEGFNGYVRTRAQNLEVLYPSSAAIQSWTRDVVFVPNANSTTTPGVFVVFDRTVTTGAAQDPHMSWNFPPGVTHVSGGRYNVTDGQGFKGALTYLLPTGATASTVNVYTSNKLYQLQVRPASTASGTTNWLTVLDTANSAGGVAAATIPSGLSSNVNGVQLAGSTNAIVLFGAGSVSSTISGDVLFTAPATANRIVISDLPPGARYNVNVTGSGPFSVRVTPYTTGTAYTVSQRGTLFVNISSTGTVSAGT